MKLGAGGGAKKLVLDLDEQRPRPVSAASAEHWGPYLGWRLWGGWVGEVACMAFMSRGHGESFSAVLPPGPSSGQSYVFFIFATPVPRMVPDTGQLLKLTEE